MCRARHETGGDPVFQAHDRETRLIRRSSRHLSFFQLWEPWLFRNTEQDEWFILLCRWQSNRDSTWESRFAVVIVRFCQVLAARLGATDLDRLRSAPGRGVLLRPVALVRSVLRRAALVRGVPGGTAIVRAVLVRTVALIRGLLRGTALVRAVLIGAAGVRAVLLRAAALVGTIVVRAAALVGPAMVRSAAIAGMSAIVMTFARGVTRHEAGSDPLFQAHDRKTRLFRSSRHLRTFRCQECGWTMTTDGH